MTSRSRRIGWALAVGLLVVPLATLGLVRVARDLVQTRPAVSAFARIIAAGNVGDLATVRELCTARFQAERPVELAPGGGVAGLPRQVHPNFRVWIEGNQVWLCPGNRLGTVYKFRLEGDAWKLDGVAGLLGANGRVTPIEIERSTR